MSCAVFLFFFFFEDVRQTTNLICHSGIYLEAMHLLRTANNKHSLFIKWSKLKRMIISFQESVCAFSGTIFHGFFLLMNRIHGQLLLPAVKVEISSVLLISLPPKMSITHRSYFRNMFDWINKLIFFPSSSHLKSSHLFHSFIHTHTHWHTLIPGSPSITSNAIYK